jgi:hypothetical protein
MMRDFALAIGVLVLVGTLASYLLPVTILIQMQILRVGVFMLYFSMIYFAFFISKRYEDGTLSKQNLLILSLGYILIPTVLVPILIYFVIHQLSKFHKATGWLLPLTVAIPLVAMAVAIPQNFWSPGVHIFGPQSEWREVQEWAKDNTDLDALFITPPQIFWHYTSDWRVFSQRSTVVTIPELMEIPFYPPFEQDFKRRLNDIAPGAIDQFSGNYIQTLEVTGQAFYTNTTEDFIQLSCTYQADYLVVEQGHAYDLTPIYENDGYIVYQLPGCVEP